MKLKIVSYFTLSVSLFFTFFGCSHLPETNSNQEKVILVHGFGRSPSAMENFSEFLENSGYQVYRIGYRSFTQDINGIQSEFSKKMHQILLEINSKSTQKIHFIGHSLGGLVIRSYLSKNKVENLGNVVTMGSPNKGTPVVDYVQEKWYASIAGPAVMSMSSSGSKFLSELKPPEYNLGVIAGVVQRQSSIEREAILPGPDDGVVPLYSTKVRGAKGFVVLPVSHYMMRYSQLVAFQAIHFLKKSKFSER